MSLKNLVNKAKKSKITKAKGSTKTSSVASFQSLNYNLHLRTPDEEKLVEIFEDCIKLIHSGYSDEVKKKLLLATYRIALSQDSRATGCFHPSEISTEDRLCRRKMYFQKGRVKKDVTYVNFTSDNRMMRLVDLGTIMHLYIQENLDRLGVLIDFEIPVQVPKYGIEGKMDGAVRFVGYDDLNVYYDEEEMALEIKTINDYGFKSLRKPKPEHLKQASIYSQPLGYKRILFLYYNKNISEIKLYVQEVDFDYVDDVFNIAGGVIADYNTQVRDKRTSDVSMHDLPDKICKSRTSERAMHCEFADYCFSHKSV